MGPEDPIINYSCVTHTRENAIKIGPYVLVKKKKNINNLSYTLD